MNLNERVEKYISAHSLLNKDRLQLVALSGGADSVCLLLLLSELGYQVEAIHCNFNLRGEESLRDEKFCQSLCNRLGIPLHLVHFDTIQYAQQHKLSIEMAARELRYRYFDALCKDLDAESVCVAHHADDNAETLLLNLIRGTGVHGLCGMRPRNGYVVRPLLTCRREQIVQWLDARQESFVTDSTNLQDDAVRNKVRHHLMPLLSQLNPSVVDTLNQTAEHLTQVADYSDAHLEREAQHALFAPHTISIHELEQSPSPQLLLFHILHPLGFNTKQISQISQQLHCESGRIWQSADYQLLVDREQLIVEKNDHVAKARQVSLHIPIHGVYRVDSQHTLRLSTFTAEPAFTPSRHPLIATLDAEKVTFPLTLRTAKVGDRFQPYGMKGTMLLSDFMTNRKLNRFQKQSQLVTEDANRRIVWVVGMQTSQHCCITNNTKTVLKIELCTEKQP